MPKYSVLEVVLESRIDFKDKENMTRTIINRSVALSSEIQKYLGNMDC